MLTKNKTGAVILSSLTVLAFALTAVVVNVLLPYWQTGDMHSIVTNPENLTKPGDVLALAVILVLLLAALVAIGAYWLYKFFGEAYYGRRGAVRWIIFGVLLALLLRVPDWFFPTGWPVLKGFFQFLSVFVAFALARLLVPIHRKPA
jgi:hypothetical protein